MRARDVALSLTAPTGISILNVFPGAIQQIDAGEGPQMDVLIDVGVQLIARVTRKSVEDLKLKPGSRVYTLTKAVALDHTSLGGRSTRSQE